MMNTCLRIAFGTTALFASLITPPLHGQDILPPAPAWNGKSTGLIASTDNEWITTAEKSDFTRTPGYTETLEWLNLLCNTTSVLKMERIGVSANGRGIPMVIASNEKKFGAADLQQSPKPLLLIQAGIHAGEIDGKDAGMMLLRDITMGKKKDLLNGVNILFIPILNVDGHERSSKFNRINQRGPENMGWRTNARNLNLNRDYTKLDTEEIRAVVAVINSFDPDLYLDLHVTDGADYQYDITYGFSEGYSPAISAWLRESLTPMVNSHLKEQGHIPGPLIFANNGRDFMDGVVEYPYSARFSNNYGDIRRLPSILVENHSLKPFRQRVLGTYVFLEAVIQALAKDGDALRQAITADRQLRPDEVVLTWQQSARADSMVFAGIRSSRKPSQVTGKDFVEWTGEPITTKLAVFRNNKPERTANRPRAYWVPSTYPDVIRRIREHGVQVEVITEPRTVSVRMFRIQHHKLSTRPFEGHVGVTGNAIPEARQETFFPGSVRIDTNQPLGDLVMHLLEPFSPDSFLQWGFFMEIFNRTEYVEEYAIEPLALKMLKDKKVKQAFDEKKKSDPAFVDDADAVYEWFYRQSPYVDSRYLLYPVGLEE